MLKSIVEFVPLPKIDVAIASVLNIWLWQGWRLSILFRYRSKATNEGFNLWLACPICNRYKGDRTTAIDPETAEAVALFNPRTQVWSEHFQWSEDGLRIIGKTAIG